MIHVTGARRASHRGQQDRGASVLLHPPLRTHVHSPSPSAVEAALVGASATHLCSGSPVWLTCGPETTEIAERARVERALHAELHVTARKLHAPWSLLGRAVSCVELAA